MLNKINAFLCLILFLISFTGAQSQSNTSQSTRDANIRLLIAKDDQLKSKAEEAVTSIMAFLPFVVDALRDSLEEGRICLSYEKNVDSVFSANFISPDKKVNLYAYNVLNQHLNDQELDLSINFFYKGAGKHFLTVKAKSIESLGCIFKCLTPEILNDSIKRVKCLENCFSFDLKEKNRVIKIDPVFKTELNTLLSIFPALSANEGLISNTDSSEMNIAWYFTKYFTIDQLQQINQFYTSPVGKKILFTDSLILDKSTQLLTENIEYASKKVDEFFERTKQAILINDEIMDSYNEALVFLINYDISSIHYADSIATKFADLVKSLEKSIVNLKKNLNFEGTNSKFILQAINTFNTIRDFCIHTIYNPEPQCDEEYIEVFCTDALTWKRNVKCLIDKNMDFLRRWENVDNSMELFSSEQYKFSQKFHFCLVVRDTNLYNFNDSCLRVSTYANYLENIFDVVLYKNLTLITFFCDLEPICGSLSEIDSSNVKCLNNILLTKVKTFEALRIEATKSANNAIEKITNLDDFDGDSYLLQTFKPIFNKFKGISESKIPKLINASKQTDVDGFVAMLNEIYTSIQDLTDEANNAIDAFYKKHMPKEYFIYTKE